MRKEFATDESRGSVQISEDRRYVTFQGRRFSFGKAKVKRDTKDPKRLRLQLMEIE